MANCIELSFYVKNKATNTFEERSIILNKDYSELLQNIIDNSTSDVRNMELINLLLSLHEGDMTEEGIPVSDFLEKLIDQVSLDDIKYPLDVFNKSTEKLELFNYGSLVQEFNTKTIRNLISPSKSKNSYNNLTLELLNIVDNLKSKRQKDFSVILTDGYVTKIKEDILNPKLKIRLTSDNLEGALGVFLNNNDSDFIVINAKEFFQNNPLRPETINTLNHELLHYILDENIVQDSNLMSKVKQILDLDINNELFKEFKEVVNSSSNKVSEAVMYLLTTPELAIAIKEKNATSLSNLQYILNAAISALNVEPKVLPLVMQNILKTKVDSSVKETENKEDNTLSEENEQAPFKRIHTDTSIFMESPLAGSTKKAAELASHLKKEMEENTRIVNTQGEEVLDKKGNPIKDFNLSYGDFEPLNVKNKSKVFRYKQGDLVRYKFKTKEGSELEPYAPIIYSYISKKDGDIWFALAGKEKPFYVNIKDVIGFRESFGVIKKEGLEYPQEKLKTLYSTFKNYFKEDEDGKLSKDSIYSSFEIKYDDGKKSFDKYILKNNKGVYISLYSNDTDRMDSFNFDHLKEGDLIEAEWKNGNDWERYKLPVLKTVGNAVQVVIPIYTEETRKLPKDKREIERYDTKLIPKSYIRGAVFLTENHQNDIWETALEKLKKVNRSLFNDPAYKKETFIRYNRDGTLNNEKPAYNDLYHARVNIEKLGKTIEDYSKWRKEKGEDYINDLTVKKIEANTTMSASEKEEEKAFYIYYYTITERQSILSSLKFGDIIELDRPAFTKTADGFQATDKTRKAMGTVLSRNGNWLNVLVFKPKFEVDESGDEPSYKIDPEGGSVYIVKVNIFQERAEVTVNATGKVKQHYAIRATYYDNSKYEQLVKDFDGEKHEIKKNAELLRLYFKFKQDNPDSEIPEDFESLLLPNRAEDYAERLDNDEYVGKPTKLAERFELIMFEKVIKDDKTVYLSEAEKLKHLSYLQPGSIVLLRSKDEKIPYYSSIVVDIDPYSGLPIIGFINNKIKTEEGGSIPKVTIMPAFYENIIGVGIDTYGRTLRYKNSEGEDVVQYISPDSYFVNKREKILNAVKKHSSVLYFDTEKEAQAKIDKAPEGFRKKLRIQKVALVKEENKKGKVVTKKRYYDKEKHKNLPVLYTIVQEISYKKDSKDKTFNKIYNDSEWWGFISKPKIQTLVKNNRQGFWDYLKVGDIIKTSYKTKKGTTAYGEYIIDSKIGNEITAVDYYIDYEASTDEETVWGKRIQYFFNTEKSLSPITEVKIHKDNRNYKSINADIDSLIAKTYVDKNSYQESKAPVDLNTHNERVKKRDEEFKASRGFSRSLKPKLSKEVSWKSSPVELSKLKKLGDRLENLYGKPITYLNSEQIAETYPNGYVYAKHRAFVDLNNNVVINTDLASLAEPLHEYGHLVMDGLKKTQPSIYEEMRSKIQKHSDYMKYKALYPELSGEELDVEVFLNVFGEYYGNKLNIKEETVDFVEEEQSFFKKLFNGIKRWLAKLFGIDSHKLFALDEFDTANLTFNNLFDDFGAKLLNGDFKAEIDILVDKSIRIKNNNFLKDEDGKPSKLYEDLIKAGVDPLTAQEIWLHSKSSKFKDWYNNYKEDTKAKIKEGVEELFDSNPELANQIYEVLAFKQIVIQDDKSYYRGQIKEPTIDKDGNLVLYGKEDKLYKRAGLKSKGVSMTDNLKSAIEYGNGQLEVAKNLISEENIGIDLERELDKLDENGYYLIQIPKNISNEIVKEAGEVKVIGNKIIIPKGQYKIEQVIDGVEQITPQQKQQALQLYSQYLESLNKPDTNPILQGNQSLITSNDKVIFGHPGIGKTYLKERGRTDVIDFDSDYKIKINEKFNLPKGFKARNDFQKSNKEEYQQFLRELWNEAKKESKRTGKQLFASDMILLREFADDFDKVITMSKGTFINRAKQRNDYTPGEEGTEGWKKSLDIEIAKIDKSKVFTTDKYLSELLSNTEQEQVKKFAELQERLSNKEFLEGAKDAYKSTPALQQLGTQEEYNDYIARVSLGIIKNPSNGEYNYTSQVKDIVYHGTDAKFDKFKPTKPKFDTLNSIEGVYNFTTNKEFSKKYGKNILSVLLNISKPIQEKTTGEFIDDMDRPLSQALYKIGKQTSQNILAPKYDESLKDTDAVINKIEGDNYAIPVQTVISVFEPEQIHILGSKADIEGFKEFVNKKDPELYYRISENEITKEPQEIEDLVFVRNVNGKTINSSDDVRSVFNLMYNKPEDVTDINSIAHEKGLPLIGEYNDLIKSVAILDKMFKDHIFVIENFGITNVINHYRKPPKYVSELRNKLLKSNYVTMIC